MKDSFFLECNSLPEEIEAAYRICMKLQRENKLKVKIIREKSEKLVSWELIEDD